VKVFLSRVHFPVTALGPGRRLGLWFQGCSIRCPGCISVDTWQHGIGEVDPAEIIDLLDAHAAEAGGLTISGGEPFEQPDALALLLRHWRGISDRSILIFTGKELASVKPWLRRNTGLVDAIIAGPYRSELPQTLALRGSDNQQLHVLTALGRELLEFDRPALPADRRLDVMFDEAGDAWIAGIPSRGDIGRLRRALAAAGHRASTSADQGPVAA